MLTGILNHQLDNLFKEFDTLGCDGVTFFLLATSLTQLRNLRVDGGRSPQEFVIKIFETSNTKSRNFEVHSYFQHPKIII